MGLIYDGVKWTWKMPDDKSARLLVLLGKGIREGQLLNKEAMSLAGKINHYGKKDKMVKVDYQARVAMVWWLLNMRALSLEGSFIPDPAQYFL